MLPRLCSLGDRQGKGTDPSRRRLNLSRLGPTFLLQRRKPLNRVRVKDEQVLGKVQMQGNSWGAGRETALIWGGRSAWAAPPWPPCKAAASHGATLQHRTALPSTDLGTLCRDRPTALPAGPTEVGFGGVQAA